MRRNFIEEEREKMLKECWFNDLAQAPTTTMDQNSQQHVFSVSGEMMASFLYFLESFIWNMLASLR